MKKLLLIISVSLISAGAYAQCGKQLIPSTAIVKTNDNAHIQTGDALWICENRTVDIQGDNNNVFVEKNSVMTISGNNNKVWVRVGGSVTITGDMNRVTIDSAGVSYTDNGTNTNQTICEPFIDGMVRYDYTHFTSVTGCIDTSYTGIESVVNEHEIVLYPNPVSSVLNVTVNKTIEPSDYKIYSISGKLVLQGQMVDNPQQIDLTTLDKGLYFIELQSADGKISKRISVE